MQIFEKLVLNTLNEKELEDVFIKYGIRNSNNNSDIEKITAEDREKIISIYESGKDVRNEKLYRLKRFLDLSEDDKQKIASFVNIELKSFRKEDFKQWNILFNALDGNEIDEFIRDCEKTKEEKNYNNGKKELAVSIEKLHLSTRASNCLYREGIINISEITNMTTKELESIRNLGKTSFNEIVKKIHKMGLFLKDEAQIEEVLGRDKIDVVKKEKNERDSLNRDDFGKQNLMQINIQELGLSTRVFDSLINVGILNVEDLTSLSIKKLYSISNIGEKSCNEIVQKIHSMGLYFNDELQTEDTKEQKEAKLERVISDLKEAYITLIKKEKELQDAIQERTQELERVKNEKITTQKEYNHMEELLEENKELFLELSAFKRFSKKIKTSAEKIQDREQKEIRLEAKIESLEKEQEDLQSKKEEIKKQIHDLSQEL